MTPERLLTRLLALAMDRPEQTAAAATALATVLVHYRQTGRVPLGRLPWRIIKQNVRELGNQYFRRPRPRGVPALVVDAKPDDLEDTLRNEFFESVDLYSYEYADEAWNLRRPQGTRSHPETGAPVPMELHPRGFLTSDGRTLVSAHDEASRFEAYGPHLNEVLLSWKRGRDGMTEVLDQLDVEYEEVESERAADITVEPPAN
jgi:hypothetical protein